MLSRNMSSPGKVANGRVHEVGEQNRGSPRYVFFVLWYRRYTVIAAVSATLLAALVYMIFSGARYTATTTLVLDFTKSPVAHNLVEEKAETRNDDIVESNVLTIKSENVVAAVIRKLKLTNDPEFRPSGIMVDFQRWISDGAADEKTASDEKALHAAIEIFNRGLSVSRIPKSYGVEIAYTSLDRKKAASIANAVAEAYIQDQLNAKLELTKRARGWLQESIAELRHTATAAFKSIQDFKSQNNLVSSDGKLAMDIEIEQLTQSLAKARAVTTLFQSRLAEIKAILSSAGELPASAGGLPDGTVSDAHSRTVSDALSNTVITKLRQQYLEDEKLAIEYGSRYGTNHQTVIKLRSEMADLKRGIREEEQRIAETYKSDLKVAEAREKAIEIRLAELFRNDSGNRQAQVKLRELETAANTYRSVYQDFLNRYTQTVEQQTFPSAEARVITFASIGEKTSPKILLTLLLATIGGASLGRRFPPRADASSYLYQRPVDLRIGRELHCCFSCP